MKAIYKCRLCGEVYSSEVRADTDSAINSMTLLVAGLVNTDPRAPEIIKAHNCGGDHAGSLGLADFQGWEMED